MLKKHYSGLKIFYFKLLMKMFHKVNNDSIISCNNHIIHRNDENARIVGSSSSEDNIVEEVFGKADIEY